VDDFSRPAFEGFHRFVGIVGVLEDFFRDMTVEGVAASFHSGFGEPMVGGLFCRHGYWASHDMRNGDEI
jgi:hypothetical protein